MSPGLEGSDRLATETRTWQIVDGQLVPLESTLAREGRTEPGDLESWIVSDSSVLGPELLIIGRQVITKSGPLDILAVDRDGNTIVVELKRDKLPREALAQAVDYASDVASWPASRLSEICERHAGQSLEDAFSERFADVDLENLSINATQRILLVGFGIESSLERMIQWLSDSYSVSVNALVLSYVRTSSGDELVTGTSIIPEEIEKERVKKRRFTIPMSDDPGDYEDGQLSDLLFRYLSRDMYTARRIRGVLLPTLLSCGQATREELKQAFVRDAGIDPSQSGYFLSLISGQLGMEKNDFLRQVIAYEYPNYSWEKDNYRVRGEYRQLVQTVLDRLDAEVEKGDLY